LFHFLISLSLFYFAFFSFKVLSKQRKEARIWGANSTNLRVQLCETQNAWTSSPGRVKVTVAHPEKNNKSPNFIAINLFCE
jgi:hypothetical protein